MVEKVQSYSNAFVALAQGLYYLAAASTFVYVSVHLHKLLDLNNFFRLLIKAFLPG